MALKKNTFNLSQHMNNSGESELILAFAGAVGVELDRAEDAVEQRLKTIGYTVTKIRLTTDIIPKVVTLRHFKKANEFARVNNLMDAGNEARVASGDNAILARGVAKHIAMARTKRGVSSRRAYLVHSLKHPDEVTHLRQVYPRGFYLIGVHDDPNRKLEYVVTEKDMSEVEAEALMGRDLRENVPHGQRIADTFHLADFFVRLEADNQRLKNSLWRIVDILFGDMHKTPNFGEYAMFMHFLLLCDLVTYPDRLGR